MERREYIERQIELLEISKKLLKDGFSELRKKEDFNDTFGELFFNKSIPPHIKQPLNALIAKLLIKPAVEKVAEVHKISGYEARKMIRNLGYSEALKK